MRPSDGRRRSAVGELLETDGGLLGSGGGGGSRRT